MPDEMVQDLLDDLAGQLGHGLFVDSVDGRLIAYSSQDTHPDPARVAAILARRVAPEIRRWQNRHGIARATAPVRLPANPGLGLRGRLCVPIRHGERRLGYLWLPDEALGTAALEAVAEAAAELARLLAGRTDERENLLRRLLAPDRPGTGARDRLADLDPSLLGSQVLVCAAVPISRGRERVPALSAAEFRRLATALPREHPECVGCFVTATHVAAVSRHHDPTAPARHTDPNTVNRHGDPDAASRHHDPDALARYGDRDTLFGRNDPAALDRALRVTVRRPFAVGVGDPAGFDVEAVRQAYKQARAAAEAAALDPALPRILHWSGAGPYRMLAETRPDPVLAPLERTGLLPTLETYLDLGCDVRRTAASLHLHRTTVYYRLDRIAALLGADLRDGLVRSHLHLALKARRLDRARVNGPRAT
ncbi:helix-turn-helix domain-containing protein [Nonomuraea purpurea]|uniref:Helix-turn-helix domain-containing protein n=1 Tax=Nonomuraea purpurea TaxID=1849276 RepID=A0ABV8GSD1_9ACTN